MVNWLEQSEHNAVNIACLHKELEVFIRVVGENGVVVVVVVGKFTRNLYSVECKHEIQILEEEAEKEAEKWWWWLKSCSGGG